MVLAPQPVGRLIYLGDGPRGIDRGATDHGFAVFRGTPTGSGGIVNCILALLLLGQAAGQQEQPKKPAATKWVYAWRAEAEVTYDSNIWLLENENQERLRDHDRGGPPGSRPNNDEISGRYDGMETVDDFILTPGMEFHMKGPSPLGNKLDLGAQLQYSVYSQNDQRNYLELDLGAGQGIGSDGHLELRFEFIPEYFRKNYLSDATDRAGNVNAAERRFDDGTYRQWEIAAEYSHKLVDRTEQQPFGLTGGVELVYHDRTFDSPFTYRDENSLAYRLKVGFEYGPRVKWGIHYKHEAIDSPTESIVMVRNELIYGVPLNDDNLNGVNGDPADAIDDNDARTVQQVNRTRKEDSFGLFVGVELTSALEIELAYERTLRDFESDERFDAEHLGRKDERDEFGVTLKYKLSKAWAVQAGYEWRWQESDLDDPEAGDDGDYNRDIFFLAVGLRW
jgi:hypothetical protein